jgi:hypothetical protein
MVTGLELPAAQENPAEAKEAGEHNLPEMDIRDLPVPEVKTDAKLKDLSGESKTAAQQQPQAETDKLHKYPTADQLRRIKEKGLVVY